MERAFKVIRFEDNKELEKMKNLIRNMNYEDLLLIENTQTQRNWYGHSAVLLELTKNILKTKKIQERLKNFN